jgi:hypothetical protein
MKIAGWATAEVVGTDSGTVRNRMSVGTVEARQVSRWRNRIRAWGSGEPATYQSGSWAGERATLACSRVGWSSQPSNRWNRVALVGVAASPNARATSCAGAKRCLNGKNGCLLDKGWRKVNHRVIEQAPGSRHALRNGGSALRRDRAEHDGRASPGARCQQHVSASPDSMR